MELRQPGYPLDRFVGVLFGSPAIRWTRGFATSDYSECAFIVVPYFIRQLSILTKII